MSLWCKLGFHDEKKLGHQMAVGVTWGDGALIYRTVSKCQRCGEILFEYSTPFNPHLDNHKRWEPSLNKKIKEN